MTTTTRRLAARLVLAAAVAFVVVMFLREGKRPHGMTLVVDPRPAGDTIRSIRVDLADGGKTLGWIERAWQPGEPRRPLRLQAASAPGPHGEVNIELDTTAGPRRLHQAVTAPAGATVTITIDGIDD